MRYNTSILDDFEFFAYGSYRHFEKWPKLVIPKEGLWGFFFGDSTQPKEPSDKVSAWY